jgi:spore coat protein U-like protein
MEQHLPRPILPPQKTKEARMGSRRIALSGKGKLTVSALGLLAIASAWPSTAQAQVTQSTGELEVRLLVNASCDISGSSSGGLGTAVLDFGTATLLQSAIDADTGSSGADALEVLCNPGVAYTLTFDAGQNASVIADRAMKREGGTELVSYQLYSDAGRASVLNTISGTGTGTSQAVTVYGRVPAQTAPPPGNYRDVVIITVAF